jgi:hypothetical protein
MLAKANPEHMVEGRDWVPHLGWQRITGLSGNRQATVAKYSCVLRLPVIPFGLLGLDLKVCYSGLPVPGKPCDSLPS